MLAKPLAACTHLFATVSQLFEQQVQKSPFSHTAAHIFVSPGDAPAYVTRVERQFNACQTPRSMYLSIFNSFRVIRCLNQCVSPKIAIFYHILVYAPGAITLNVVLIEREFDTYKLSCSMYPSVLFRSYSNRKCKKSPFSRTAFDAPVRGGGVPVGVLAPLWYRKTRMVSVPDGEKNSKISLFVLAQLRNVSDRQTDGLTDTG